ncbi:hypothetical protein ACFL0P_07355 [Candidatus Omnitrophota bacterium]
MNLKEHENLIRELQDSDSEVVLDGAVNNEVWSKNSVRILWILKETHGKPNPDNDSQDLRILLKKLADDANPNEICPTWQRTYGLAVKVSHGLLGDVKGIPWGEWAERVDKIRIVLREIAVININKHPGGRSTTPQQLVEAARPFYDVTLKQIDLLDPTIIISGLKVLGNRANWWLPKGNTHSKSVIEYHPGAYENHQQYYERIKKALGHVDAEGLTI